MQYLEIADLVSKRSCHINFMLHQGVLKPAKIQHSKKWNAIECTWSKAKHKGNKRVRALNRNIKY